MSQCIYCGSSTDLNTSLTITLDNGIKHTVDICDLHAEDASVRTAKAAFLARQDKIQQLLEQAKALGLTVSQTPSGLLIAEETAQPEPAPQSRPEPRPQPKPPEPAEEGFISTEVVDRRRGMTSVSGNTSLGPVESLTSYDVSGIRDQLPEGVLKGKVKMGIVEGREGQPLAVPQQRVDGTGTTRINITKAEDDRTLQQRFKKMAQDSLHDQTPDFAKAGYQQTTTNCPVCRGDGVVKMGKGSQTCPKCNGSGIISTY